MLTWPELSRIPSLKTRERSIDATLRDPLENGMEATAAMFTHIRREYEITIEFLSQADKARLDDFVDHKAVQGVNPFQFPDNRDPRNPKHLLVRFAKLPEYTDQDNLEETGVRQKCTFTLRTV